MQNHVNPQIFVFVIIVLFGCFCVLSVVIFSGNFNPVINYPDVGNATFLGISYELDFDSIPSIVNGLTSATSIIIGFTGTIVGILYGVFIKKYDKLLLLLILLVVLFPLFFLFLVYYCLITGVVDYALRLALFALVYSFFILAITLFGSFYRLTKNENNQKNKNDKNNGKNDDNNNGNNKLKTRLDMIAIAISIVAILISGIVGFRGMEISEEANSLTRETIEFQRMLSDYPTNVSIIESEPAQLLGSTPVTNESVFKTNHWGWLNLTVRVVTAHHGRASIKLKDFDVTDDFDLLIPEMENQTTIDFLIPEVTYEKDVYPSINTLEFFIQLKTSIYPNPSKLPDVGLAQSYPLGELSYTVEILDDYTGLTQSEEFSERVYVSVEMRQY